MEMEFENILYVKENGIATITLNRPETLNSSGLRMIEELIEALEDARRDSEVKVVVGTGAGRAFSSGGNVREMSSSPMEGTLAQIRSQMLEGFPRMARLVREMDKPYIGAINGPAIGGGMELSNLFDIRIASERAFFSMAYIRMGQIPAGGGCYILPRIIGIARAAELIWTGRRFSAEEALQIGYVSRVVPHDELLPQTMDLASQIAKGPSVAIQLDKHLIYRCLDLDLDNALEAHSWAALVAQSTEDAREGPRAWVEKREPMFKGR